MGAFEGSAQIVLGHDVVAGVHTLRFVATDFHGDISRDSGHVHKPARAPAQIVKQPPRNARLAASRFPRLANVHDWFPVVMEDERRERRAVARPHLPCRLPPRENAREVSPHHRNQPRFAVLGVLRFQFQHVAANIRPGERLDLAQAHPGAKGEQREVLQIVRQVGDHGPDFLLGEKSFSLVAAFREPTDERRSGKVVSCEGELVALSDELQWAVDRSRCVAVREPFLHVGVYFFRRQCCGPVFAEVRIRPLEMRERLTARLAAQNVVGSECFEQVLHRELVRFGGDERARSNLIRVDFLESGPQNLARLRFVRCLGTLTELFAAQVVANPKI